MYFKQINQWEELFSALPCDECCFFEKAMDYERQKDNVIERLMANDSTKLKRKKGNSAGRDECSRTSREKGRKNRRSESQNCSYSLQSSMSERLPFDVLEMCGESESEQSGKCKWVEREVTEMKERLNEDHDDRLEPNKRCASSHGRAFECKITEVEEKSSRYQDPSGVKNGRKDPVEGKNEIRAGRDNEEATTISFAIDTCVNVKSDHLSLSNECKSSGIDNEDPLKDNKVERRSVHEELSCGLGGMVTKTTQNRESVDISALGRLNCGFQTGTGRRIDIDPNILAKRKFLAEERKQKCAVADTIEASNNPHLNESVPSEKHYTEGKTMAINSQVDLACLPSAVTNANRYTGDKNCQLRCSKHVPDEELRSLNHQGGFENGNGIEAMFKTGLGRKMIVGVESLEKSRVMLNTNCMDEYVEAGPPYKMVREIVTPKPSYTKPGMKMRLDASDECNDMIDRNTSKCKVEGDKGTFGRAECSLKSITKVSLMNSSAQSTSTTLFETGRGQKVTVATKSLEKSRFIIDCGGDGTNSIFTAGLGGKVESSAENMREISTTMARLPKPHQVDALFSTGSGRKVVISAESMERSRAKMEKDVIKMSTAPIKSSDLKQVDTLFATGSGRKVVISAESLERSCAKRENDAKETACAVLEKPVCNQVNTLFSTGSGRKVVVSGERLDSSCLEFRSFVETPSKKLSNADALVTQTATERSTENVSLNEDTLTTDRVQKARDSRLVVQVLDDSKVPGDVSISSTREKVQCHKVYDYRTPHKSGSYIDTISPTDRKIDFIQPTEQQKENIVPHAPATPQTRFRLKRPSECKNGNSSEWKKHSKRFKAPTQQKGQFATKPACTAVTSQKPKPINKQMKLSELPYRIQRKYSLQKLSLQTSTSPSMSQSASSSSQRIRLLRCVTAHTSINVVFKGCDIESEDSYIFHTRRSWTDVYETTEVMGPKEIFQLMTEKGWLLDTVDLYKWFCNQYRWIVFLCAQMELTYSQHLCGKYLTLLQIIFQVHQRYKREVYNCQRPIIRKILNGDASPSNCLVLLVAAVLPGGDRDVEKPKGDAGACGEKLTLVLTDGWYAVYGIPDELLEVRLRRLHQKAHLVGKKIIMWNAELQCSGEGIEPLENELHQTSSTWKSPFVMDGLTSENKKPFYILRYNSTRLGAYDLPLGLERSSSRDEKATHKMKISRWLLSSVPLQSLQVGGGIVRSIRLYVTRVSPLLHMQAIEGAIGPRVLTDCQLGPFQEIFCELSQLEEVQMESMTLPTPFIQLRAVCSHFTRHKGQPSDWMASLNIWRPTGEMLQKVVEGREYFVTNVAVNWKSTTSSRDKGFLKLSATKRSTFEIIAENEENTRTYSSQTCKLIRDLKIPDSTTINALLANVCVVVLVVSEPVEESIKIVKGGLVQTTYTQHIFVADSSCEIASVRVSSTSVTMGSKSASKDAKPRCRLSSTQWFRRARNCWQEGKVISIKGLQISHRDKQLQILDCKVCDFTEVCTNLTSPSSLYRQMERLKSLVSTDNRRGRLFRIQLARMKQYIEQAVLHTKVRITSDIIDRAKVLQVRVLKLCKYRPPVEDQLKQDFYGCAYVLPLNGDEMASSITLLYFNESQLTELSAITGEWKRLERPERSDFDALFQKVRQMEGDIRLIVSVHTRPYLQKECRLFPWQRDLVINVVYKLFWAHFLDFEHVDEAKTVQLAQCSIKANSSRRTHSSELPSGRHMTAA